MYCRISQADRRAHPHEWLNVNRPLVQPVLCAMSWAASGRCGIRRCVWAVVEERPAALQTRSRANRDLHLLMVRVRGDQGSSMSVINVPSMPLPLLSGRRHRSWPHPSLQKCVESRTLKPGSESPATVRSVATRSDARRCREHLGRYTGMALSGRRPGPRQAVREPVRISAGSYWAVGPAPESRGPETLFTVRERS